jgi:hypothetical protein
MPQGIRSAFQSSMGKMKKAGRDCSWEIFAPRRVAEVDYHPK